MKSKVNLTRHQNGKSTTILIKGKIYNPDEYPTHYKTDYLTTTN